MDQAERLRKLVEKKPEATLPQVNGNARVIAVTSGKGGVGKTNLTENLAIALGITGQRVLVIDADKLLLPELLQRRLEFLRRIDDLERESDDV